jgi:copper oxidase (laccase) domain-containing protein/uncharacterized protein (DUF736 family)
MAAELSKGNTTKSPIYRVFSQFHNIGAAYTGKGTSSSNNYFSFYRPTATDPAEVLKVLTSNLKELSIRESFDPTRVIWPNGPWPHSGNAIKVEDHNFITNPRTGGLMPVTASDYPVTYDGIATVSVDYVLAVQGADCPAIFFYDPSAHVIGLAHAGWKPLVRGVIPKTIQVMKQLGARPENVLAYISPGCGDKYNQFLWDGKMESHIRDVFVEAGREDLLEDRTLRYEITDQDREALASALGREVQKGTSFKISEFATVVLEQCGVLPGNVSRSLDSSIVSRNPCSGEKESASFRYHSFRREQPKHGLSISILFLKGDPCGGYDA